MIDSAAYSAELYALILSDPRLRAAAAEYDRFAPDPDLLEKKAYDWVAEYAPKLWAERIGEYKRLDDKAASIASWVSGGVGLLAAGLALAVADNKVPWAVGLAFLVPVSLAVLCVVSASGARAAKWLYPVPDVATCLDFIAGWREQGRVAILAEWHKATTRVVSATNYRARCVEDALRFGTWAAVLLALPLIVAIARVMIWPAEVPPK